MLDANSHDRPLRVGSLFSGYGGLDLAVEHALDAETVWFSENNQQVARIFSGHSPGVPNLGDITTINWRETPPVDVLCGGFPCQDVSTVGKRAGLAPGTRSGLWSHMAKAIDALQPELVVIENVRGLLSSSAIRPPTQGDHHDDRNPAPATPGHLELSAWGLGDDAARPLRAAGAVLGDLADLGMDARWIGLPASLVGAPHHRYRIFIAAYRRGTVPHPAGLGLHTGWRVPGSSTSPERDDRPEPSSDRPRLERTAWLTNQAQRIGDAVAPDREHFRRWGGYAHAIARWEHINGRTAPAPALLNDAKGPRPAPAFVEWLMGLPAGWVTAPEHELTSNQQVAALGNGVRPLHAAVAIGVGVERT